MIQVASIHRIVNGAVNDTPFTVTFDESNDPKVFIKDIEDSVAIHLLDIGRATFIRTGNADFWKPGTEVDEKLNDPPADVTELTVDSYDQVRNVAQLRELLAAVTDRDMLMQIIAKETQGKNRESWNKALNEKWEALKPQE